MILLALPVHHREHDSPAICTSQGFWGASDSRIRGPFLPEPKPSLEQITEQLRQAEAAGDPWKAGIAYNNLGDYYKDRRDTAKALEHFQKRLASSLSFPLLSSAPPRPRRGKPRHWKTLQLPKPA